MGGYHSLLTIGNGFSSVDQVETIAIQASDVVGSCPKILCQTRTSKKGGPCHVSLICACQEKAKTTINQNKATAHLNSCGSNDTSSQ
eukprot:15359353-Ditylum_brightwellii.AAC.1